jgi:aspartate/methionine/tyrosine aminotransferase
MTIFVARAAIEQLPASRVREVANAGLGRSDVLAFWFGEGDAAKAAFDAGDTFYNHHLGLAKLRAALAGYLNRLRAPRTPLGIERIAIASAGVNAPMLAAQAPLEPGDRVVIVTPVWSNLIAIPQILGAQVVSVPLTNRAGAWALDLDRLLAAATPGTRMRLVDSPTIPPVGRCRSRSGTRCSRIAAGTASGSCPTMPTNGSLSMRRTGWRLGWLVAPPALLVQLGKLIEFNTSCAPPFVQQAAVVALQQGEPWVAHVQARLRAARDLLLTRLTALPGVVAAPPAGAMYLFLRVPGVSDNSLACAKALVREAGLGLAPGSAFGAEGEGWLRWCFAATPQKLDHGAACFATWLQQRSSKAPLILQTT